MSKFYGTLQGSRGEATRCGTRNSGITTQAASWKGVIEVRVYESNGEECFDVSMIQWHGTGDRKILLTGKVGDSKSVNVLP